MEIQVKVLIDFSDRVWELMSQLPTMGCRLGTEAPTASAPTSLLTGAQEKQETTEEQPANETTSETANEAASETANEAANEAASDSTKDSPGIDVTTNEGLKEFLDSFKTWLLGSDWKKNRSEESERKSRKVNAYFREIARELGASKPTELSRDKRSEFCNKITEIQLDDNGNPERVPF